MRHKGLLWGCSYLEPHSVTAISLSTAETYSILSLSLIEGLPCTKLKPEARAVMLHEGKSRSIWEFSLCSPHAYSRPQLPIQCRVRTGKRMERGKVVFSRETQTSLTSGPIKCKHSLRLSLIGETKGSSSSVAPYVWSHCKKQMHYCWLRSVGPHIMECCLVCINGRLATIAPGTFIFHNHSR